MFIHWRQCWLTGTVRSWNDLKYGRVVARYLLSSFLGICKSKITLRLFTLHDRWIRVYWKSMPLFLNIFRHFCLNSVLHSRTRPFAITHHLFEILCLSSWVLECSCTSCIIAKCNGIERSLTLLLMLNCMRCVCSWVVNYACCHQTWNWPIWVKCTIFHSLHLFSEIKDCLDFRCIEPRTV